MKRIIFTESTWSKKYYMYSWKPIWRLIESKYSINKVHLTWLLFNNETYLLMEIKACCELTFWKSARDLFWLAWAIFFMASTFGPL